MYSSDKTRNCDSAVVSDSMTIEIVKEKEPFGCHCFLAK